jgi:hypothetical protein
MQGRNVFDAALAKALDSKGRKMSEHGAIGAVTP